MKTNPHAMAVEIHLSRPVSQSREARTILGSQLPGKDGLSAQSETCQQTEKQRLGLTKIWSYFREGLASNTPSCSFRCRRHLAELRSGSNFRRSFREIVVLQ